MTRRLDFWIVLATFAIAACAYLAQNSISLALDSPGFAERQLVWFAVGTVAGTIFAFSDYRIWTRFWPILYAGSITVLAAMPLLAPLRAGTRAWIVLGSFTVQPSEFARIPIILGVAAIAAEIGQEHLDLRSFLRLSILVGAPMVLVALQPDLGVALTYTPILLAALWMGGLRWKAWAALALAGVLLAGGAWVWYLKPYQKERVLTFVDAERDPFGAGYQQRQSRIAVGSGGLTGKGLHAGTQSQLRFLPRQHTDFIFAVWAEETGFVGASILLAAYALLVVRIFLVALASRDRTGAVIVVSIGAVLLSQILVNISMVIGVAPTTGITLPLLSYGGSSVIATFIGLGMVQSVWRMRFANV